MLREPPTLIPRLSMKLARSSTTSERSIRFLNANARKDVVRVPGFWGSWNAGESNRIAVSRVEMVWKILGSKTGTDKAW